jgi:hypothetical protein
MHKSDPFVFPLAFQESQTRQQMRAGQAAQMAGQKQPPVVDQDLAQMTPTPVTGGAGQTITGGHGQAINALPEDQGIGALNAPNLQNMADGGIAGYAGDDESLVHLSPFAMKQIMGDMATSGAGVNANADLGEAGRLSGGVNLNRMDKDRESRQMQALMANYMNNIGEVGINANVSRPLERGLPSDFYQTNLMGSVPVGEGRLTIGKHGTHAGGEHHTNAHSIGYNTPFEGGRLNANINKPVEGRPSFGVQYNRAFADGGIAGYADGGQQPGMFNYAQMAPAVDLHPDSGVTPRSMAGGGITGYAIGGSPDYSPDVYRRYALQKAREMGISPELADSIFKIESGYKPNAVPRDKTGKLASSAVGIGQLKPNIASYYGIKPEERTDGFKNIDASLAFMKDLQGKYNNDPQKIAVGYNQGEKFLNQHLKENAGSLDCIQKLNCLVHSICPIGKYRYWKNRRH